MKSVVAVIYLYAAIYLYVASRELSFVRRLYRWRCRHVKLKLKLLNFRLSGIVMFSY